DGGQGEYDTDIESIRQRYNLYGSGQTVAVIDSGIAYDHAGLGDGFGEGYRVVGGYDFAENDANPYDDGPIGFHGTHVAGVVGGNANDFQGVAPEVDLVALRVFDDNGAGDLEWVERALQWVHDHQHDFENPITTVNLSLGTGWNEDVIPDAAQLEDEFAQLKADGIFISVASGNLFQSYNEVGLSYPATSPHVVPVASHGADGSLSDFSQRNERVLVAPGERINSTVPDYVLGFGESDGYSITSGTSQAAPFVAGASTLLREAFQRSGETNIDQDLLYEHFLETSDTVYDSVTGHNYQRLNLNRAIEAALSDDHGNSRTTATSLGVVNGDSNINGAIETLNDIDYFSFVASETGIVELHLSANNQFVPALQLTEDYQQDGNRVSFEVTQGNEYHFAINSSQGSGEYVVEVKLIRSSQNGVGSASLNNGVLTVRGTAGHDDIGVRQDHHWQIDVNGQQFSFDNHEVNQVVIVGGAGFDSIEIEIQQEFDRAVLSENRLSGSGVGLEVSARGFESIDVEAATSVLVVRDSQGHDLIDANYERVVYTGSGIQHQFSGFERAIIHASDGSDQIRLTGSVGNDRFQATPEKSILRSGNSRLVANHFDQTTIFAGGGEDFALLDDSFGTDQFMLGGHSFHADLGDSQVWGAGFERVIANSETGMDSVVFNGSSLADQLIVRNDKTRLSNGMTLNVANGFHQVVVYAGTGNDTARFHDSVANDLFYSDGANSRFETIHGNVFANGFKSMDVIANHGGLDTAILEGSVGQDRVVSTPSQIGLQYSSGIQIQLSEFDEVSIDTLGGYDLAEIEGSAGRDVLSNTLSDLLHETSERKLTLKHLESVDFDGGDGVDEVFLTEFESMDLLQGFEDSATAFLQDWKIDVSDIEYLDARAKQGELASHDISAVDYLFSLGGDWESV
ncbi:MAG: S8 family serine peptidase, partial [Planctomycetota bacterium]